MPRIEEALENILKGAIEDLDQPYDGSYPQRPVLEEVRHQARRQAFEDTLNILEALKGQTWEVIIREQ